MFRRFKCYLGFHDFDGPYAAVQSLVDSFYYCKGKCGSHIRWEQGLPRYGVIFSFKKPKAFMVEVSDVVSNQD